MPLSRSRCDRRNRGQQFKQLADKCKADLGFVVQYTSLVSDDVVKRAVTQPSSFDLLDARILDAEEDRAVGQSARHRHHQDQVLRPDRPDLYQGQAAGRQTGRDGGHLADQGRLSYGGEIEGILQGAVEIYVCDPDRLQRRHARHSARSDQAPDRVVGGATQPRVQGQGGDPRHPVRSASWTPQWRPRRPAR